MRHLSETPITACIPYYRCRTHVRRAVDCMLTQTHRNITVIVINDGDPDPPWPMLADIKDPRLVRFDLPINRGPYFATALVAGATTAPYLLIQDADDWSAPTRASVLLNYLERDRSDFAFSAQPQYVLTNAGSRILGVRWLASRPKQTSEAQFTYRPGLNGVYRYRAPHHGLFRTDSLRRIGGYYGGFRISYDTLLTNLIMMTGRVSHVAHPLYYRQMRGSSLTHADTTGFRSQYAKEIQARLSGIYRSCFDCYRRFSKGEMDSRSFCELIARTATRHLTNAERRIMAAETLRLKRCLDPTRRAETVP
ncbi:glycosyltransferase family 2 protein [Bradyrhizobium sp. McL0616]|uniref:glycosyltransferase family 2 protein n=1 Tax=Bradyrhizobium sp. McL0616 TaxID=3415674 RepID=UPI003CE899F2